MLHISGWLSRCAALIALLALAACGGGGGGGSSVTPAAAMFSVNTNALSFSAASPNAPTPSTQAVTATVTGSPSGTLYILVNVSGPAVTAVSNFVIAGNSGQGTVTVAAPNALGSGTFTSTITVRACLNDATCATGELSGSPQTISATYVIGLVVVADAVMPHAVTAGASGQVVIRGHALTNTTSVGFGTLAASAFTVVSDSEIHATYPATLSAGTYAVTLNGGATSFSGSVAAVAPTAFAGQTLVYPEAPLRILSVVFDAERKALLVAATFSSTSANKLWRYSYSGGAWATAAVTAIPELRDIALSVDGKRLIALTSFAVLEVDPANPSAGTLRTVPAPFPASSTVGSPYLKLMALANDGNALIATGAISVTGYQNAFLYSSTGGTFTQLPMNLALYSSGQGGSPNIVASADGSRLLASQSGLSPPASLFQYSAATGRVTATSVNINEYPDQPAALDNSASKIIAYAGGTNNVYDATYALLGTLPGSARLIVVKPDGTRAYGWNQDSTLHSYDLTAPTVGGAFPQVGAAVTVSTPASNGSATLRSAITPDGGTLFVAGDTGVAVVPALP